MVNRTLVALALIVAVSVIVTFASFSGTPQGDIGGRLSGESFHDFGEIDVASDAITLRHSFALTNETNRPILIREVRRSCGCLEANVDADHLEPGSQVNVSTAIRIYGPGRNHERVILVLDDETFHVVELHALGRRGLHIAALPRHVQLSDGEETQVTLLASNDRTGHVPEIVKVEAPDGISVELGSWSVIDPDRLEAAMAVRWELPITIQPTGSQHTPPVRIAIHFADHDPMIVPVEFK